MLGDTWLTHLKDGIYKSMYKIIFYVLSVFNEGVIINGRNRADVKTGEMVKIVLKVINELESWQREKLLNCLLIAVLLRMELKLC